MNGGTLNRDTDEGIRGIEEAMAPLMGAAPAAPYGTAASAGVLALHCLG